ncbi:MAG: neutral zinc metallopeptidase [Nocardioidaceae bacterium]|nr:neutral zinc metallopeptidase [Nocardioidaceae bacterium]
MRFNPKARIDPSQVEARGGGGSLGGGGMRLPLPSGGGGQLGVGGLVVLVLFFVVSQCAGVGPDLVPGGGSGSGSAESCQTGEDANKSDECAVRLFTESVQNYWGKALQEQGGPAYDVTSTVTFSGQTDSACGTAASQMGPFYCPNDKKVYVDSTFFDQMLEGQLGAEGGPFSIGYVIAHEYGHHIEDQLGILARMRTQQGPKSDGVKVELMADCLGGMWAKEALTTTDTEGTQIISELTPDDIARAIDAAQAVGDDRIQKRSSGRVNPEQWTHGSAEQRQHWFNVGLKEGSLEACNTFAPGAL